MNRHYSTFLRLGEPFMPLTPVAIFVLGLIGFLKSRRMSEKENRLLLASGDHSTVPPSPQKANI